MVVSSLSIGACAPALVAGGGSAGYYAGTSERSVGTITSDGVITSKINAEFVKEKSVSAFDINVDTYRGVVTLHGSVGSQASANRAIAIARGVKGVKKVISQLTVVSKK
ncbi:MAG: BON domain-containing protein [Alphaproteobacteria bacterium]|nr:BON domain-containing protein [Alphaproteobacteria bacterium]